MVDDARCCGTGTCLINAEGLCWCGQQWVGDKMCFPESAPVALVAGDIPLDEVPKPNTLSVPRFPV